MHRISGGTRTIAKTAPAYATWMPCEAAIAPCAASGATTFCDGADAAITPFGGLALARAVKMGLLAQGLRQSEKYDVYSFRVILLELVTGRKPVESPTTNEVVVLCEYVRGLLETSSASNCFDRNLLGFAENELIQVMRLGLI
ncbi:probable LRR receptor-like serine/threonine-protein kinase At1g12460 [Cajanus cajan]|uniref:probable LRR receptor-like serine/threonine-protein kinase At1g12460 n=1 Tax=Cajanus cajan TaxID=3821 RepID=UPI00098DB2E4|nr:probable LRR receptor-like serine/threonine-protein kinase At1g12460 [Cajanus cajan]